MEYQHLVRDFAHRTRRNLEFIEAQANHPDPDVFEVTQLINSMLGLLVFPQQSFVRSIPETPLADLEAQGWPHLEPRCFAAQGAGRSAGWPLNGLVRCLRNAIAHFNLEFLSDGRLITGVRLWNVNRKGERDWEVALSLQDLRLITRRFIEMLEAEQWYPDVNRQR